MGEVRKHLRAMLDREAWRQLGRILAHFWREGWRDNYTRGFMVGVALGAVLGAFNQETAGWLAALSLAASVVVFGPLLFTMLREWVDNRLAPDTDEGGGG